MVLFQCWELQSTKKEDLQLLFSRELRHPEVVGKKVRFGKPQFRGNFCILCLLSC